MLNLSYKAKKHFKVEKTFFFKERKKRLLKLNSQGVFVFLFWLYRQVEKKKKLFSFQVLENKILF